MAKKPKPLVSVVTPAYNGEAYLPECVESVLAQTYSNWEYTIINNCSTDGTGEIAESYARCDARIRVLHNDHLLNQGQSHNYAFQQISDDADYVKAVFADDWLYPECLERMVEVAEGHPSVGVVASYRLKGTRVVGAGLSPNDKYFPGREACRRLLLDDLYIFGSATTILLRADIVRNRQPFFNEPAPHMDTEACHEILREWDLGFVHQVLTVTRVGNPGVSSSISSYDTGMLDRLIIVQKYGPDCLEPDEFRRCLNEHRYWYLRHLGRCVLERRPRDFWDYHRVGLEWIGIRLSARLLAPYVVWELADAVLNPKLTLGRMVQRLKR